MYRFVRVFFSSVQIREEIDSVDVHSTMVTSDRCESLQRGLEFSSLPLAIGWKIVPGPKREL